MTKRPSRPVLSPAILSTLREIQEKWDNHQHSNRAFWLDLGELWFKVCDDKTVARGDLKKLAPFFNVSRDHLARCRALYAIRADLPAVDAWIAENPTEDEYPGAIFGQLQRHRAWKNRSQTEANRLARTVHSDKKTGVTIIHGDTREVLLSLPDESVDCIVTSPPYHGMIDFNAAGQIGLGTVADYLRDLVDIFDQLHRLLRKTGTVWLNIDDRWAAMKRSDPTQSMTNWGKRIMPPQPADDVPVHNLMLIPDRLIAALQRKGWTIRSRIIWVKTDGVRESVGDRPPHCYEYVFMLTKGKKYHYDKNHKVPAKHPRYHSLKRRQMGGEPKYVTEKAIVDVWYIPPETHVGGHPAPFPRALAERCLSLGCPAGGHVLDPFCGSGTTGVVAKSMALSFTGIDINKDYCEVAGWRIAEEPEPKVAPLSDAAD